jgi:hypothetical protein
MSITLNIMILVFINNIQIIWVKFLRREEKLKSLQK